MLALTVLSALAGLVAGQNSSSVYLPLYETNLQSCPSNSSYSCENTTAITNTCCSPTPGGLQLQTQFWDTYTGYESQGQLLPAESWTIHGLWPDNCDGSYSQYCDLSRQFDPYPSPNTTTGKPNGTVVSPGNSSAITAALNKFGQTALLDYMNEYWVSQGELNQDFWAHEFSKHATCTSTFDTKCYSNYTGGEDIVDFVHAVVRRFQQFPTYNMLASRGIVPSNTTRYAYSDILSALRSQTGAVPYLGCQQNGTVLSEVWYNGHVLGTPQFGAFKGVDSPAKSNCNANGTSIWYYERTPSSVRNVESAPINSNSSSSS